MEKLLLTPEEAAAIVAVGRTRMYELMRAGLVESVRIGASRRVPARALEEYVRRLQQESQEPVS